MPHVLLMFDVDNLSWKCSACPFPVSPKYRTEMYIMLMYFALIGSLLSLIWKWEKSFALSGSSVGVLWRPKVHSDIIYCFACRSFFSPFFKHLFTATKEIHVSPLSVKQTTDSFWPMLCIKLRNIWIQMPWDLFNDKVSQGRVLLSRVQSPDQFLAQIWGLHCGFPILEIIW